MWIPREIEELLRRQVAQRPVLVLTGARQTGKTSLVQRLFPRHSFVSLDLPSEAALAENDPDAFLERHPPPLIVDEVQYAPRLFRHLKVAVDRARARNGQFILTGSQRFALMQRVSESLAGRAAVAELEGLTFAEIRAAQPHWRAQDVMARGAFPELYEKPDLDAAAFHRAYLTTYLERDLRTQLQVTSLRDFERFLRACALRTAQLLNRAELARDVGIAPSTAGQWLSVLEASSQVAILEPWFANRTKSLVKSPKLHLSDTGLCAVLMGVRAPADAFESPMVGALWESFVFSEARRRELNRTGAWQLYYYRDRTREADLLSHNAGRFSLVDAKWTESPSNRDAGALLEVAKRLPETSVTSMAIVCRVGHRVPIATDPAVSAVPVEEIDRALSR